MKSMSAEMEAALVNPDCVTALLMDVDHPAGRVYAWSGTGALSWNGQVWQGAGLVAGVTGVGGQSTLVVQEQVLVLSGIPANQIKFLDGLESVRGRKAFVWLAALDIHRRVIPEPMLITSIILDYQTIALGEDGTFALRIVGNAGLWNLESAPQTAWTHESQQAVYPDDDGFRFVSLMVDRDVSWTPV